MSRVRVSRWRLSRKSMTSASRDRRRHRPTLVIEARCLDLETAADVYGLSTNGIRRLIEHSDFPCVKVGRRSLVPVVAADEWFIERVGTTVEI
jgi:hypothetical protein